MCPITQVVDIIAICNMQEIYFHIYLFFSFVFHIFFGNCYPKKLQFGKVENKIKTYKRLAW